MKNLNTKLTLIDLELVCHVTEAFLWPVVQVLSVSIDPNSKLAIRLKDSQAQAASLKTANK